MARQPLPVIRNYTAFLSEWAALAKLPRAKGAPTVVSTFAGAGGSSTGYRMAGWNVLLATDYWEVSCETYRANWPDGHMLQADITRMDGKDLLAECGVGVGELDVLDGSPPCQGFSIAGNRVLDDPRNSLFLDFCRVLRSVMPRVFIMENVAGLLVGKMRPLFRGMTEELAKQGYVVAVRRLDALLLGVPQTRHRLVWVGVREDLGLLPVHPVPSYSPPPAYEVVDVDVAWLANPGHLGRPRRTSGPAGTVAGSTPRLGETPSDANSGYLRKHPDYAAAHDPSAIRSAFNRSWRNSSKPSPTVTGFKPELSSGSSVGSAAMHHREYSEAIKSGKARQLTIAECAALQSFPEWYVFKGSKGDQMKQVGNAVPPLMAAHVALAVASGPLGRPLRHDLPDPSNPFAEVSP